MRRSLGGIYQSCVDSTLLNDDHFIPWTLIFYTVVWLSGYSFVPHVLFTEIDLACTQESEGF